MITLTQNLDHEDYLAAAAVHYDTYRMSKIRPWLAGGLVVLGVFILTTDPDMKGYGIFCICYGIFMYFRKHLWIRRGVRSALTAKRFGEEIEISVNDEGLLRTNQGPDRFEMPLASLYGYVQAPAGILLYPQRNIFYFLKAEAFESSAQMDALAQQLEQQGVKNMKG